MEDTERGTDPTLGSPSPTGDRQTTLVLLLVDGDRVDTGVEW